MKKNSGREVGERWERGGREVGERWERGGRVSAVMGSWSKEFEGCVSKQVVDLLFNKDKNPGWYVP